MMLGQLTRLVNDEMIIVKPDFAGYSLLYIQMAKKT